MPEARGEAALAPRADRLPPQVKGLGAVSLCNDFASEMVYPVLPAFVTGPLGGSAVALGALDGAADLASALIRWGSGRLADRPGWSKPLIGAGYGLALLVRPLIALASAAWQVVGLRVVDRAGKGLRSPARDALIARLTPDRLRGRAFGFHRGADHLGAVAGSLVAWAMLSASLSPRSVIGWSVVPGVVALLVLGVVLRSVDREPLTVDREPTGDHEPSTVDGALVNGQRSTVNEDRRSTVIQDRQGTAFWVPVGILVVLTVARLPETLLLLRLQDVGVPLAMIPLAWAALHVVRSSASYPGGALADRAGVRWALGLGSLVYAAVLAVLAAASSPWLAVGVFLLHGIGAGLTEPAERLAIARLAPVRTGRGFGAFQGLAGVLALPAGLAFGLAYRTAGGPTALLLSAAVLTLGALLWLGAAGRYEPEPT
jgi:MFS family permease